MGADIHSRVEVKEGGRWRLNTDRVFKNMYYYSDEEVAEIKKRNPNYERTEKEFLPHPSDGRSYDWFAVLADVRNGRGFAGIKTGDGFQIIDEPRGVPDDATREWKEYVEEWGDDLHSISWLKVEDFDKFFSSDKDSIKEGVITLEEYKSFRGTNKCPEVWSGAISGAGIETVSQAQADDLLDGKEIIFQKVDWIGRSEGEIAINPTTKLKIHVRYRWTVSYKDWFKSKIEEYVNPMKALKEKYEDVRLVFGFDN